MVAIRAGATAGLLACGFLVIGCGGRETTRDRVAHRDSAGIAIVESPASLALAPLSWSVADHPEFTIGQLDGEPWQQLHRVAGIAGTGNGGLLIVNGDPVEIRFFDSAGRFLKAAGRAGDGPGEFRFPLLVPFPGGDSLWIYDRVGRFSVLGPEGEFGRVHAHRVGYPVGVLPGGRVLIDENSARAGLDTPEGIMQSDVVYELADPVSGVRDTVAELPGQALYVTGGARPSFTQVPFDVATSAAVSADHLFLTAGEAPEVRVYSGQGTLRAIWRLGLPRERVTRDAFTAVAESRLSAARSAADSAELRRRYGRMPIPAHRPTMQRLLVDRTGHLWAEQFAVDPSHPRRWFVFDPTGGALGLVETPARFVIEEIGADYVLGRWPAGDSVERVERFRLRRSP